MLISLKKNKWIWIVLIVILICFVYFFNKNFFKYDEVYQNNWYKVSLNKTNGNFIIKTPNNKNIIKGFNYSAKYGYIASVMELINKNDNSVFVNNINGFYVGAEIEFHSEQINNSLIHTAVITEISKESVKINNGSKAYKICFTPEVNINTYGPGVHIISDKINNLDNVFIKSEIKPNKKIIEINGNTDLTSVKISLTFFNNSPRIEFETETKYLTDVKVFNESIEFISDINISEIYLKNRKITKEGQGKYWLDKQGIKFGEDSQSLLFYHNPNISSASVCTKSNSLFIDLDDMRDHRFRHVEKPPRMEGGKDRYIELHASEYKKGDSRINTFSFIAGKNIEAVPRLMLNPHGYLSTYIWTEHADATTIETNKAVYYGASNISSKKNATGGFVKHNIPVTKSVFYSSQNSWDVGITNHKDGEKYLNFLIDLYNAGYEICLHSVAPNTADRELIKEAIPFMKNKFNTVTWIDHGASINRECISSDGLNKKSNSYAKDLWKKYDTKYFWTYASEDVRSGLDLLMTDAQPHLRTPLYWKHPTITGDFYTWAAKYINPRQTGKDWNIYHNDENLKNLINNRGVVINHTYPVIYYENGKNGIYDLPSDKNNYEFTINEDFDNMLKRMAKLRDKGDLNLTTIREIMEYWTALNNIEFIYINSNEVQVKNNNNFTVEGLSLAVHNQDVEINKNKMQKKYDSDDTIFWFDINPNETVKIFLFDR